MVLAADVETGSFVGDQTVDRQINVSFQPEFVWINNSDTRSPLVRHKNYGVNLSNYPGFYAGMLNYGIKAFNAGGFVVGNAIYANQTGVDMHWMALRDNGYGDIKIGTYVGNGGVTQSIAGLGFTPSFIHIQKDDVFPYRDSFWRTNTLGDSPADAGLYRFGNASAGNYYIESLDADGFTVGQYDSVNDNGITYFYLAIKNGSSFRTGTYIGDGIDDREISLSGTIKYVAVKKRVIVTANIPLVFRMDLSGTTEEAFDTGDNAGITNAIQSFTGGGFQIGTHDRTNTNGADYDWWAFGNDLSFNTAPNVPSSLGSSALVDGSWGIDSNPSLSFNLSDPDTSDQVQYQIQIDNNADFSSVIIDYTSTAGDEGSALFTVGQAAGLGSYAIGFENQTLDNDSYYWRVKAIDDDSEASIYSTANSGAIAFKIDTVIPSDLSLLSPTGYTKNNTKPTLVFRKSTDQDSGISSYSISLDSGKNRSFSTTNIPSSGNNSASYTWKDDDDVKIEFRNEDDISSSNDEVHVYFKELSANELTEGKHSWTVTVYDSASNSITKSTNFYIDKTAPSISELAITDVSTVVINTSYNLDITNRTPSLSGFIKDVYQGSSKTNNDSTVDAFDKVSSGPINITLTIQKLDDGQDSTSHEASYSDYLIYQYSVENATDIVDDSKSAKFYITTSAPLVDGYYRVRLTTADNAGNTFNQPYFYLSINAPSRGGIIDDLFKDQLEVEITDQSTTPYEKGEEALKGYIVKIKILDKEDNPVEGATVTLHSKVQKATTNQDGIAEFKNVEKGEHTVTIALNNYEGERKLNLTGEVKQFDLNITIEPKEKIFSGLGILAIVIMGVVIISLGVLIVKNK